MLPRDEGPTLIDSGEFQAEGLASRGLPVTWDDDDDDEDEKETGMMRATMERSSQRNLRVLPAVPTAWTPPPPPPSGALPPINPPAFRTATKVEPPRQHWVPEPPPPRVSQPFAAAWLEPIAPELPAPQPFFAPEPTPESTLDLAPKSASEPEPETEISGVGPHVAITLATPRTRAKRQRILRRVILPWPAVVMIAAVAGGVIFELVEAGEPWSVITATAESAQRLVRH